MPFHGRSVRRFAVVIVTVTCGFTLWLSDSLHIKYGPLSTFSRTSRITLSFNDTRQIILSKDERASIRKLTFECNKLLTRQVTFTTDAPPADRSCLLHKYNESEISQCLHRNKTFHLAMIGDSRIKGMAYLVISNLRLKTRRPNVTFPERKHIVYTNADHTIRLDHFYLPYMDDVVTSVLKEWINNTSGAPDVIMLGCASWTIKKYVGRNGLDLYKGNLTKIKPYFQQSTHRSVLLWKQQTSVDDYKLSKARKMITNTELDAYNEAAADILSDTDVHIWNSSLSLFNFPGATLDGIHYADRAYGEDVQLLLNYLCKREITQQDESCCNK